MTKYTVVLESGGNDTKALAYRSYGAIAEACENVEGLSLVEITDDSASATAKRKYTRKTNGKEPKQLDIEHDALKS